MVFGHDDAFFYGKNRKSSQQFYNPFSWIALFLATKTLKHFSRVLEDTEHFSFKNFLRGYQLSQMNLTMKMYQA